MKAFVISLLFACGLAQAQTVVDLSPAGCGAGVWCASVPNDSGHSILLYGSTNYQDSGVTVGMPDGTVHNFMSQNFRGYSVIYRGSCPMRPAVGYMTLSMGGNPVPMTGANGTQATVIAIFTCTSAVGGSGRGAGVHQIWNLVSGTLVLP